MTTATATPPAATPPTAATLDFVGVQLTEQTVARYLPGKPAMMSRFAAAGIEPTSRPRQVTSLAFLASDAAALGDTKAAVDAAKERLRSIRDNFRTHPSYIAWLAAVKRVEALQAEIEDAKLAPEKALAEARKLVAEGKDSAAPEAAYRDCKIMIDILQNRLEVFAPAVLVTRSQAEKALHELLEAERVKIEAQAAAEAQRLADEIQAFVSERLARFRCADLVAEYASGSLTIGMSWGRAAGSTAADDFAELPQPPRPEPKPVPIDKVLSTCASPTTRRAEPEPVPFGTVFVPPPLKRSRTK